ncbi:MAG: hypothetical protein ACJ79Q_04505 [Gemmatimonadaceae bacterium]|jgi:hypothetical protein
MDRMNSRAAQVYGYAVCFITVIVMLISIKSVVDALFDLSDPIRAEGFFGRMGRPLTSFEVYKIAANRERTGAVVTAGGKPSVVVATRGGPMLRPVPEPPSRDTLSDADLRKMYDAEREDVISNARFQAKKSLLGNLLLLVLAGALFGIHWRWLKQRDVAPVTP